MKNIFFLLLIISCQQKEIPKDESLSSSLDSAHFFKLIDPENSTLDLAEVILETSDGLYTEESLDDFLRQNLTIMNGYFISAQIIESEDSISKKYTLSIKPNTPGTINIYIPSNILKYDNLNFYSNEASLNITVQ